MKKQMLMGIEIEREKQITEIFISRTGRIWWLESEKWLQEEEEEE